MSETISRQAGAGAGDKMRTELVILLVGAVVAAFVNLVWETLDYGFPDDLAQPEDDKERKSSHLAE